MGASESRHIFVISLLRYSNALSKSDPTSAVFQCHFTLFLNVFNHLANTWKDKAQKFNGCVEPFSGLMTRKVSGLMAGARGAVAILSLNEGPPRSFLVGESLAQGVRLAAIEGDAVVIERGTQHTRIKVSTLPDSLVLPRLTRP